ADKEKVTFTAYFNLILLHEVSHELGSGLVKEKDGQFYNLSYYLRDLYSIIEEAKADVMAIYSLIYLIKKCVIVDCTLISIYTTFLASLFRSIRFGNENAIGKASIIQWNFLNNEGVFVIDSSQKISFDLHKMEKAIEKLMIVILTLEGEANYQKIKNFISEMETENKELTGFISLLKDEPIDIYPWFPLAKEKKLKL
ncbi:MAG: hypothetical protein MJB14_20905, partial [Spirochaetes bacterium]|nr:hypothetical protein [Spirochaetota bacterium]